MLIKQVKRPGDQSALDLGFFVIQMCGLHLRSFKSIDFQHSFIKQIFVDSLRCATHCAGQQEGTGWRSRGDSRDRAQLGAQTGPSV